MITNNTKWILILLTSLLFISCNKEEFGVGKQNASVSTAPVETGSTDVCSDYTLIRPPVDLLFLWDNSTSIDNLSAAKKAALSNTLNYISDRFDYQVMIAPLKGTGNDKTFFFSRAGSTPTGVTVISKSSAIDVVNSITNQSGAAEAGASRVRDLISNNMNNGGSPVFRKNAYTVVVLLSNEDDDSYIDYAGGANLILGNYYADALTHDLLCLKGGTYNGGYYNNKYSSYPKNCNGVTSLNSSMMRFLTIAPNSNIVYKKISQNVSLSGGYTGQTDFTKLSISNFSSLFDQVNSVIADQVINHKYNFWPVAGSNIEVDSSSIRVYRNNGSELGSGEFNYIGKKINKNTRYYPSPGEPYTGHMIELMDSGEVVFPNCLKVTYQAPAAYYGYCHIPAQPLEDSISVKVNGTVIDSSKWELLKTGSTPTYFSSKNIRIKSPSNFSPEAPAENKSGYFIKLDPSAVYTNSQTCDVSYFSTGQINN